MVPRSGASPDPTIPPLIFVLFLSCISSPHNILTFLYGRMRIDRNTWQIKGEGVFMAQVSREKRLFTYKGMSEELDPVNIRLLEELQCNPPYDVRTGASYRHVVASCDRARSSSGRNGCDSGL